MSDNAVIVWIVICGVILFGLIVTVGARHTERMELIKTYCASSTRP